MALIECPDCGKQVSDAAPACIGCGRPLADFAKEQEAVAAEADDGWSEAARKEMARDWEARHGSEGVQSNCRMNTTPMSEEQGRLIIFLLACLVGFAAYHTVKIETAEAKLERSFRGR